MPYVNQALKGGKLNFSFLVHSHGSSDDVLKVASKVYPHDFINQTTDG